MDKLPVQLFEVLGLHLTLLTGNVFERVGCNKVGFGWLSGGSVDKLPLQLFEVLGLHLTLLTGNVFEVVPCMNVYIGSICSKH